MRENVIEYVTVLDLIRLADDRWLVRAAVARRDGSTIAIEEILVCKGVPNVEAVIDVRADEAYLVLRERQDHDHVLVERALAPETAPLRVVWDASQWDVTRTKPATSTPGPVIPA
jgi:hypothetical protein